MAFGVVLAFTDRQPSRDQCHVVHGDGRSNVLAQPFVAVFAALPAAHPVENLT
jgi:hypothetical protein